MKADDLHANGTYAELKLDEPSKAALLKLAEDLGVMNAINPEEMHTTLIYSRKPCPRMQIHDGMPVGFQGHVIGLERWDTRDGKRCLVALVECGDAHRLHRMFREEHGATHDFPEYKPHVTLSYDCGDGDHRFDGNRHPIRYTHLSVRALDPDWKSKT